MVSTSLFEIYFCLVSFSIHFLFDHQIVFLVVSGITLAVALWANFIIIYNMYNERRPGWEAKVSLAGFGDRSPHKLTILGKSNEIYLKINLKFIF